MKINDLSGPTNERFADVKMNICQPETYPYDLEVTTNKSLRKETDDVIQKVKAMPPSRERVLAITKLQEGVMWLGMDLKRLGEANPYPNSYDASNTKIEPTADNLKL